MELIECVERGSLAVADDVDQIMLDSRLMYDVIKVTKQGRSLRDFTYRKFHADLLAFELGLGDVARFEERTDHDYDKRSIPDYLLVCLVDAGVYMSRHHSEFAADMVQLTKRLASELRAERARADRYKLTYHETFSLFRSLTTTRLIMKGLKGLSKEDLMASAKEDETKWRTACDVAGVKPVPGAEFEALEAVIESRTRKGLLGLG